MQIKTKNPAVIFSLSETGLAIGRSLGKQGITVYGISFAKEIGYFSKYINGKIFPHPKNNEADFKRVLVDFCSNLTSKPVLFIASDIYLVFYANNSSFITKYFLHNLPDKEIIFQIQDKYSQYHLALQAGINVPKTVFTDIQKPIKEQIGNLKFPVFIKARDVNIWREIISGSKKGYVVNDRDTLIYKLKYFNQKKVPVIVQEIIKSPDNQNCKICVLISSSGEFKLVFTLRKIHQNPIHFGIASSAISYINNELMEMGKKLFASIQYTGVGSAEFKYDEGDGKLKLIEINSRYWQQNALADFCGMNFPLIDYLESIGENPKSISSFYEGRKYVNLISCFQSYKEYRTLGEISFGKWLKDIKGKKTVSFCYKDDLPVLFRILLRIILIKAVKIRNRFRKVNEKQNSDSN